MKVFVRLLALLAFVLAVSSAGATTAGSTPPVLKVTQNSDGSLHATWTMPAGEVGMEFLFDSAGAGGSGGRLEDVGTLYVNQYGYKACDQNHWCYPDRGVPLYCYDVLYHYKIGAADCPGHQDIGDTQTSLDTQPLTNGATYWVQVLTNDTCNGSPFNCPYPDEWWSNVVQVVAKVTKSSGGGSSGGGSSSKTTTKATFSTTVGITRGGKTTKTTAATLQPGDVVKSLGKPTTMRTGYGTLTLDSRSSVGWLTPRALTAWTAEQGTIYYGWAGNGKYSAVSGDYAELESADDGVTPAAATIKPSRSGDVVTCITGKALVWPIGNGTGNVTLEAGQQVTVKGKKVSSPRRFVPTRIFWKK